MASFTELVSSFRPDMRKIRKTQTFVKIVLDSACPIPNPLRPLLTWGRKNDANDNRKHQYYHQMKFHQL